MGVYQKMVVLLDGSELAEVVFDYARELSGRVHIDLELLHVCRPQEVSQLPMRRAYMERMAEELCAGAEEIRAKYSKGSIAQCVRARGHVAVGYPAEEIIKFIDENGIDLVMMSTHGSSGVRAWDLGEVANKVIHASKAPVWLVPTELRGEIIADSMPKRLLVVPVSGSKDSTVAISHATEIITRRGADAELVLLHVVDPYSVTSSITLTRAALDRLNKEIARMKKYLEGVAEPLRDSGLTVRTEVLSGEPAEMIIEYLKTHPTQLLVMATRGRRGFSRMVFGSVTESVIHMVKLTPLLLVGGGGGRE
jgi:nucleotide-binding universal stress UspA family protein